ncbi:MAG: MMPL family transporter [Thermodesulfobacteriota bacterium]
MAERLPAFLRAPRLTLVAIALVTLALGAAGRGIQVDSAIENLLPVDDPEHDFYDEARHAFGSEEAVVVGLFADDVFSPGALADIDRLSTDLARLDGVREVLSLTTVKGVESQDGSVSVGRMMRALPATEDEARAFKKKILDAPLYTGSLVAPDARATVVAVLFEPLADEEFLARGLEPRIRARVEQLAQYDPAITGIPTLKVRGARLMEDDLRRFVPLSVLLVVLVLAWEFRTLRGVLLPLVAVVIGVVWTVGLMTLAGSKINMGTLILPPLLMAIGIAYAIHVLSRYYIERRDAASVTEAVGSTVRHIRVPLAVAWLTTVLGCVTLAFNPISAIRDFGVWSAFGITAIFLVSLVFIPAMLLFLPDTGREPPGERVGSAFAHYLERVGELAVRNRRLILPATALLCLVALAGATQIRLETNYLEFFHERGRERQDNARIAAALGGTQPLYLVIDGDGPRAVRRLEVLQAIADVQDFAARQPGVDTTLSLVDYLRVVGQALNPDAGGALPERQADVEQLLLFVDPAELAPVVTRDYARANVIVGTNLAGSGEIGELIDRVQQYANARLPDGVSLRATGNIVLLNRSADALARGQISGLWQVCLVLLILMSSLFLSVRTGLLSLVPNVVPIVGLFGLMGFAGIDLNISTSMIAVIALGIAVDDTIHYFNEFKLQIQQSGDAHQAIVGVVRSVGRPIVFTAIALSAGFLILCLSNFQPIRQFGFLASFTMAVALVAELLMTPGLVVSTTVITLWDLLYVKLGPRPHREIPLFEGLRPLQARIVVLMGRLTSAEPGAFITRRGEMKRELYVLLSGRVGVRREDGHVVLRTLGRGDVLGEMGLVRERPRSADVVVLEPTEYLVLDQGFLTRIERRHPRIAARVFLNLTRILSDRLESTTDQLVVISQKMG